MNKLNRLFSALVASCGLIATAIESSAQTAEAGGKVQSPPTEQPSPETALRQLAPNSDVKDVVAIYAAMLGCRVIFDAGLAGPVTVTLSPSATKEEAIDSIERTLLMNGFGLVDVGEKALMVSSLGKNPRVYAQIYAGVDQLPPRERIVTCVLPLKHREAAACQQQLLQYIVPSVTGYSQILADEASRSLIVTDTTSGVRKLEKLLSIIDVPAPPSASTPPQPSSAPVLIPRPAQTIESR